MAMPDEPCTLTTADHAEALHQAFQDGYAAGRASRGGILDPCPGSGRPPSKITRAITDPLARPYRGLCPTCGREYTLTDRGKTVRKHRRNEAPNQAEKENRDVEKDAVH
jgi:hypothetical protein